MGNAVGRKRQDAVLIVLYVFPSRNIYKSSDVNTGAECIKFLDRPASTCLATVKPSGRIRKCLHRDVNIFEQ